MKTAWMLAALVLTGCSSSDEAPATTTTDTGVTDTSASGSPVTVGKIAVKVSYSGAQKGSLAIGAFTEPEPKTRPPVSFDTSKTPTFPYSATLSDLEPGKYWIVAVIDLPPVSGAAVKPGPEDLQVTSMQVVVVAGETQSVEVTIPDAPPDAGADSTTD